MALVTTTGSLIRQYNAFTGLSATERAASGIARAEVVYYNVNDTWPASGVGNNRIYQTGQIDLPKDFGYVITDLYCLVYENNNTSMRANANAVLTLFPGGVLGPQININTPSSPDRQDANGNTAIGSIVANAYNSTAPLNSNDAGQIYELKNKPTAVLYPFGSQNYTTDPNPASVFNWQIAEQYIGNTSDWTVSFYARFLQYDIDQSYNYVLQSPQLTR